MTAPERSMARFLIVFAAIALAIVAVRQLIERGFGAATDPQSRAAPGKSSGTFTGSRTTTTASAYGPGLYGNPLACGGRLSPSTRAVAHRYYACGTRLRVCYRSSCQMLRVRDRGPWVAGRGLDLTERVVRRFGFRSATHWGVRVVHYRIAYRR